MAAIEVNNGFVSNSPFSLDIKYLKDGYAPYANKAEVLSSIIEDYRHPGLTVLIGKREYWFRDGITDDHLIRKNDADTIVLTADGSYSHKAGDLITHHAIKSTVLLPGFKMGITNGGEEILEAIELAANKTYPFSTPIAADVDGTIYYGGITGVVSGPGNFVIITIYTR